MAEENTNIATTEQEMKASASERFTNMVMAKYNDIGSAHQFTEREKMLIRNYFICIDQTLAAAEEARIRKNESNTDHEKWDNPLPYSWKTIDLPALAQDLAHYAHVGLDMMEGNTLFAIPYKDNKRNLYTITLMEGYNGIRYQAEKYALDPFRAVTVEVIYENDRFVPLKKSHSNPIESYEFEIPKPFDRGRPIGVFGYIEYVDSAKNKLLMFNENDVMKRKPKYAAAEFWGGKKEEYKYNPETKKREKQQVEIDGWLPEMFEKTMKRAIYGSKNIPRDPAKIDESYRYIRNREAQFADYVVEAEVSENANGAAVVLPEAPKALPEAEVIEVPQEKPEQEPPAKSPVQVAMDEASDEIPF